MSVEGFVLSLRARREEVSKKIETIIIESDGKSSLGRTQKPRAERQAIEKATRKGLRE